MKKFGKEEIQKVVLVVIFFFVVLYCQQTMIVGPAKKGVAAAEKEIAALDEKIRGAEKQIRTTRSLKNDLTKAEDEIAYFQSLSERGAPIAWFPPMLSQFFQRYGIKDVTTRLASAAPLPNSSLSGLHTIVWSVQIPAAGFVQLGIALSALENAQPLFRIGQIQIYAGEGGNSAEFQRVNLSLTTIIEKD